jgi:type IV secretory pathway VirB2 component (pilin)
MRFSLRLLPLVLVAVAVAAWRVFGLAALKAAGLSGTAPPHAAAVTRMISTLTDNWIWLIATGIGLILVILAGLMISGSRTAPDWLFRVIGGVLLILVVIPAVLA